MTMANRIEAHLQKVGVHYDILEHPHSNSSMQSALAANIAPANLAKAVVAGSGDTYRMCVIPADRKLQLKSLNEHMHGHYHLLTEDQLREIFDDCEFGAIPAFGQAYGMPVIWDNHFLDMDDIYIECGDHEHLIHIDHGAFMELMGGQDHWSISKPADDLTERWVH